MIFNLLNNVYMIILSELIKTKLSDFLVNVSASYFIAAFITPGFFGQDINRYIVTFIYYLFLAIIYFIFSINIYPKYYE